MLKTLPFQPEADFLAGGASTDPLRYDAELPFRETFHPMGYSLEVSSNSADVLSTVAKLWRRYPSLSDAPPLHLRVVACYAQPGSVRQRLLPCGEGHLFSIVHGAYDFAHADLSTGFAFASLSRETWADAAGLGYYFLEPLAYAMLGVRYFVFVHASCISRNGRGIVLCGDSGSGKTCLAYACARRGWDYVSGDAVHIVRGEKSRTVIGRPWEIRFRESARSMFPELHRWSAGVRPNGKIDLEIDTGELGLPVSLRSSARHIVFIERSTSTRLEKYPAAAALQTLKTTICYGSERTRLEQLETLTRFAELPAWHLYYSSLEQAERTLELLPE